MATYKDSYYKDYQELHEEIKKAYQCVKSNPSVTLGAEVSAIKSKIDGLSLVNIWEDSIGDDFKNMINAFSANLSEVINSIEGPFLKADNLYINLKVLLDNLEINDNSYQTLQTKKPKRENYEEIVTYTDSEGETKNYSRINEIAFNNDLDLWTNKMDEFVTSLESTIETIETDKDALDNINGNVFSLSSISNLPSLPTSSELSSVFDNLAIAPFSNAQSISAYLKENGGNLTLTTRYGQSYAVIADLDNLPIQGHDECYLYSGKYVTRLYNSVGRLEQSQTAYSSTSKQEVLNIAANEIINGRPVIVEVTGLDHDSSKNKYGTTTINITDIFGNSSSEQAQIYSRHFIVLHGLKETTDLNNVQESDFLALDPTLGDPKMLATPYGSQTARYLLNGHAATYNPEGNDYVIQVSGDTNYTSQTCHTTSV